MIRTPIFRAGNLRGVTKCTRSGAALRPRERSPASGALRAAGDDHRQRRDGESRRVLPADGEKSDSRAKYFHRQSYSHDLSGRFRRRFPSAAGRCVPGHRRFRPRVPQQRRDERHGHSADYGHHGNVRRGRRLPAGDVRSHPDDGRLRAFSRRSGAGAGGDRTESFRGRTRRRENARADQRHGGFSRAGRRLVPDANSRAGGQNGASRRRALRLQGIRESAGVSRARKFTAFFLPTPRSNTTCAKSSPASSTAASSRNIARNTARPLLCGYARIGGWAVGIVANQKKHVPTIDAGHRRAPHRIWRRDLHRSRRKKPRASSWTATRI